LRTARYAKTTKPQRAGRDDRRRPSRVGRGAEDRGGRRSAHTDRLAYARGGDRVTDVREPPAFPRPGALSLRVLIRGPGAALARSGGLPDPLVARARSSRPRRQR